MCYIIVNPETHGGGYNLYTLRFLKSEAIKAFLHTSNCTWIFAKKKGYKCIKVNIVPA